MLSLVENLFLRKNPLQDLLFSLNAVISTNESTRFITGHMVYNLAYTWILQTTTTNGHLKVLLNFVLYFSEAKVTILSNTNANGINGEVIFSQEDVNSPLKVSGTLKNLPPGLHGFHVHEKRHTGNDCSTAGGHFDPEKVRHYIHSHTSSLVTQPVAEILTSNIVGTQLFFLGCNQDNIDGSNFITKKKICLVIPAKEISNHRN